MTKREINDILPVNNQGMQLVPQILTNDAQAFLRTEEKIRELGYQEINLNLGCPSGTVVAKGKGSGFLAKQEELDHFLETLFSMTKVKISIKTRIGKNEPEEFYELIEIFNKYTIEELIIHPRTQQDFYKNKPNWGVFKDALELSKNPICYNGDIHTGEDYAKFISTFQGVEDIMLGRGLLYNPGMIQEMTKGTKVKKEVLKAFHDQICEEYTNVLFGDKNVLFKMKDLWTFLIDMFPNSEKYAKKIKKAENLVDYQFAVEKLFKEVEMR